MTTILIPGLAKGAGCTRQVLRNPPVARVEKADDDEVASQHTEDQEDDAADRRREKESEDQGESQDKDGGDRD